MRAIRLTLVAVLVGVMGWLCASSLAQEPAFDYSTFDHVDHEAALNRSGQPAIQCDVCHIRETGSTQIYYPYHDACIKCHVTQFTSQSLDICANCHTDVKAKGEELKPFPEQRQDYGVWFDGAQGKNQHEVHMKEKLPGGQELTCNFCHASKGANQGFPSHPECFACHSPNVNSKAASPELVQCSACHPGPNQPNSEMRRLINTRRNAALAYRFRHIDHTRPANVGCNDCHRYSPDTTHVISSRVREHGVRPSFNCYECHRAGGKSRITETSCGPCHGVIPFADF